MVMKVILYLTNVTPFLVTLETKIFVFLEKILSRMHTNVLINKVIISLMEPQTQN